MAKVQGALLSFGASGQVGKAMVVSRWKGRPYVRRYVVPANPQSTAQTITRTIFAWLNNIWRISDADFLAPWNAFAAGKVLTGRNAFEQKNVHYLRPKGGAVKTSLDGLFLSPGAKAGPICDATIEGDTGSIVATADAPSPLPTGWTVVGFVVAAIPEQDPGDDTDYNVLTAKTLVADSGTTWISTIDAPGDADYATAAWFIYQRSAVATDLAYGPAEAEIVTVATP